MSPNSTETLRAIKREIFNEETERVNRGKLEEALARLRDVYWDLVGEIKNSNKRSGYSG